MFRWLAVAAFTVLATQALAADLTPDQRAAICGSRETCTTTPVDAGEGPGQVKLTVVDVHFGLADKPDDAPEDGCIGDRESADAPDRDGGRELWLIAGGAAPKRILALCNDGYGAAGMGEDMIEVHPNLITWGQSGGSSWRWLSTRQIRLMPLAVVKEFDCSFHNVAPGTGTVTEIDRETLQARSVGAAAGHKFSEDDEMGCPDWPGGDAALPAGPDYAGGYAIPFPNAGPTDDGKGFPEGTVLADCALELATDGLSGFMVHGKPIDEGAAILRAIKESDSSLLIQVFDPTAAAELKSGKAKSWVGQPHIEVWVGEMGNPEDNDGPNGENYIYRQFAIGLDGKTYPGVNAFEPLPTVTHWAAKDELGHDVIVYRVKWEGDNAWPSFGVGVVYSQARDGKQVRMVSNAQIRKNKPLYLPDTWANIPEDIPSARCALTPEQRLAVVKD
jgi:hypothetical protein